MTTGHESQIRVLKLANATGPHLHTYRKHINNQINLITSLK